MPGSRGAFEGGRRSLFLTFETDLTNGLQPYMKKVSCRGGSAKVATSRLFLRMRSERTIQGWAAAPFFRGRQPHHKLPASAGKDTHGVEDRLPCLVALWRPQNPRVEEGLPKVRLHGLMKASRGCLPYGIPYNAVRAQEVEWWPGMTNLFGTEVDGSQKAGRITCFRGVMIYPSKGSGDT